VVNLDMVDNIVKVAKILGMKQGIFIRHAMGREFS
jgi:hypothetical protein